VPREAGLKTSGDERVVGLAPLATIVTSGNAERRPGRGAQAQATEAFLDITNVQKVFGSTEAIRDVSLTLRDGEFVSLLGPSGCGKSTLLSMIAGLASPTSGTLKLRGRAIAGPGADVGVVFQNAVLLPWRSALDNVLLPVEFLRRAKADYRSRALDLLRMAKLEDFVQALPRELSGGMRQRVAICRALIHDPRLLLMDEPFSALDALTRDEMAVELLRIWQSNRKTVVFVTHSIREAAFLSDRVIVMGRRPATIVDDITIDLPRPRQLSMMEDADFNAVVRQLRASIEASHGH
jgi:NitT/TauT family transport system ATP-binding protein